MFEQFPYANFHELNMDWIIKIAKDFLDQYTHIQETITTGLEDLDNKAQELEALLQAWYDTHSEDIAQALAAAVQSFNTTATQKTLELIATIPADYTALSAQVEDLDHAIKDGYFPTPINPELVQGELVQSTTGNFVTYTGGSRTGYVQLPENSMYVIFSWNAFSDNSLTALCFYDEDRTYISGIANPLLDTEIQRIHEIPDNAAYIAYSGFTQYMPALNASIGIRNSVGELTEALKNKADLLKVFDLSYVKQGVPVQNLLGVQKFPDNLVNVEDCVDNAYINWQTGTEYPNEPGYWCTGYIPVNPSTQYRANVGRNHAFYNANKVYVAGAAGTTIQNGITSPANAAYIRFTINKSSDGIDNPIYLYFAELSQYDSKVIIPDLVAEPSYWCNGKSVAWIGDSITAGYDFDDMVCSKTGMTQVAEYGINQSTIGLNGNGSDSRDAICVRYANMDDNADVVIVSGGTNDWMYAWQPFGTIDSTENTTFYGALKNLCAGLLQKYPGKPIIFTTPIHRAQAFANGDGGSYTADGVQTTPFSKNKYGKTLRDYAEAIKEVCSYYAIPVCDLYSESWLNPSIAAQQQYFDEALTHPNDTGRQIMASRMAGWLIQLKANI